MDRSEYSRIKLSVIPQEIIDEYNLLDYKHNGWIYFEIVRGCYGLPQSGRISNDLLCNQLNKEGYFEALTKPGIWRHKCRSIPFMLIVDDFGVEYVIRNHTEHLASVLKNYHEISEDWEGKKFAGIDLIWEYTHRHSGRTCRLSMKIYTAKLLFKVLHKLPVKKQLYPHRYREIAYGSKVQQAPEEDSSPALY